jgi:hypothetical protein
LPKKKKIHTFCHELAHHIQNIKGIYCDSKNLYDCLQLELEAERLAYFLAQQYFPNIKFHHKEFNHYRDRIDLDYLRDWYNL